MTDVTPRTDDHAKPPADRQVGGAQAAPPTASFRRVVGAVLWSFLGVRKGRAMRDDVVTIRPYQVILVGVAIAAVFVAVLLVIVHTIVTAAS
ncbi:MAG: DUF2970 domain-containing protein [Proteobacteria bacterium]|jgi:hypothetical protein|nr:DUF2970 domain-containing protein [Pseudomonadota bacterium]